MTVSSTATGGAADSGASQDVEVKDVNIEVAADSSNADEGVKKPESLLDAVREAVKPPAAEESKDEGAESPDAKDGKKDGDAEKTEDSQSPAEEKEPPFAKHPRWQQMLHTNRELDAKVKELAPVAEQFEQFRSHVRSAGLSADEVDTGFAIMAAMKKDPAKALELLAPHIEGLEQFTGKRLPADLQKKVEDGILDEPSAKEIAGLRNSSAHTEALSKAETERREREAAEQREAQEAGALAEFRNTCAMAVQAEEATWKQTDPDYSKKQPLIDREVVVLLREKGQTIKSKEDAVALAREAKKNVEQTLVGLVGKREPKRMVTGGGSSANTSARPKSLFDVVKMAASGG